MKAYEIEVKITPEGKIELPIELLNSLQRDSVRVIILIPENEEQKEKQIWDKLTTNQFLTGYSESDSIYDKMPTK